MSSEIDQFVRPFYMEVLHANYLRMSDVKQKQFVSDAKSAASQINGTVLTGLLNSGGWREMIIAAWFIGLKQLVEYEDRLGGLLLQSSTCFAGQAFCFAMARFNSASSQKYLRAYLDKYLPVDDREYDQGWAIGALVWTDQKLGSSWAMALIAQSQLWDISVGGKKIGRIDPLEQVDYFKEVMAFTSFHFGDN